VSHGANLAGLRRRANVRVRRGNGGSVTSRADLESWVLRIADEAMSADPAQTEEAIRVLTGGFNVFCPQPYPTETLHRVASVFLRIARLADGG
jgi:hypothetical protein